MSENLLKLKESVEILSIFHQIEILRILKKYDSVILNENKNGVFINLSHIDKKILFELENYLNHVKKQELHIKVIENEKKKLTDLYFQDKSSSNEIFNQSNI
jgi:hypothetical protein